MLYRLIDWFFPLILMVKANKKLNKDIETLKLEVSNDDNYLSDYMNAFKNIKKEEALKLFDKVLTHRKTIEDKAKSNILIVTVSVTVILGLSNYFFGIKDKLNSNSVLLILGILFSFCLIYLTIGAILSIASLNAGELKETYDLSETDYEYLGLLNDDDEKEKETIFFLSFYSELNTKINLKINNYVSSTYSFLRNSLITLCIIGVVSCITYSFQDKKENGLETKLVEQKNELHNINSNLEEIGNNIKGDKQKDEENNKKILTLLDEIKVIFDNLIPGEPQ
ncbi:hypothetical protein [Peribacillus sp. AS_2]|uniref:hypothetical protein n=1 Tax=Peribacillus sp. AS_2 TaxID=2996755 RepID=UPI0022A7805E|nr:hypothetical protein [Peribacillus sp. AS_2]MCZ0871255.1 hypothetical protein [Peribacillus sp. AS_2]